ncbi:MAG: hypothetical protein GY869_06700, partial [Planctomycetes bacterium]|nr:hypothetical protein [Planctomycetota bacterium]
GTVKYSGGTGEAGNPWQIAGPGDLIALGGNTGDYSGCFVLASDIDMSGYGPFEMALIACSTNTDYGFVGIGFGGVFDGAGFVISNLSIDTGGAGNDYLGLFGYIEGVNAKVENLGLENMSVTGGEGSEYLGGLCGENINGSFINCYSSGRVSGEAYLSYVGGLCGSNQGTISSCYSRGSVTSGDGSQGLGGLCGKNKNGVISNCYSRSNVTCGDYSQHLGGLCGRNRSTISNCYSSGRVTAGDESRTLGGLCGYYGGGPISNCYWDENSSDLSYSGGGRKKTIAQMKDAQTYMGWNDGSWVIDSGNDYPHLSWESGSGGLPVITTDYPVRTYPGDGADEPFELDSSDDLLCMSWRSIDWDKKFVLTGNIDMGQVTEYYPPGAFGGDIDGAGYSVIKLTVDPDVIGKASGLGLIGWLGPGGCIENLGVEEVNIASMVSSSHFGGLCGENYKGSIRNCYSTGWVSGGDDSSGLGGLCGSNGGKISHCYSRCIVNGGDDSGYLGGLCGSNHGTISSCYSIGNVSGGKISFSLGGLCGGNSHIIIYCDSSGNVTGGDGSLALGGLCGMGNHGTFSNCHSSGSVNGGDRSWSLGGLCGY